MEEVDAYFVERFNCKNNSNVKTIFLKDSNKVVIKKEDGLFFIGKNKEVCEDILLYLRLDADAYINKNEVVYYNLKRVQFSILLSDLVMSSLEKELKKKVKNYLNNI